MKMRIQIAVITLTLLVLTACAAASRANPTPTIVRLDRPALTQTAETESAEALPTASPTAGITPTQASVATSTLATQTLVTTTTPVTQVSTATTTPTAQATAETVQAEVLASGFNVRTGPGMNYAVLRTARQGDLLDVTGRSAGGDWLQVATSGGDSGWIFGQSTYIRLLGSLTDVPVVQAGSVSQATAVPRQDNTLDSQPSALLSQNVSNGSVAAGSGQLIFATSSGGDLYRVNLDGTGLQKLTGGVIDPVVSPDGQQVAFTRWDGAKMGTVYVLNLNDGSERVVAGNIPRAKSPTWSEDGQSLIISFLHGGTVNPQEECREFGADDRVNIPNDVAEITSMKVTAENTSICFILREDLQWGLRQIDLVTGQAEDLATDLYSFSPTWDPQNPARVIYDGLRGLMQYDVTTENLQPFTDDSGDTAPVFSPDGQELALTYKQHDHWEVYTYDLASGTRERLTKPPILADPQYSSAAPAWSPDGSKIAFVTDRTGRWEIWVMNVDGSNQQPLLSSEVQAQLGLQYNGVNERLLNWIGSAEVPATQPVSPTASTAAPLTGEWDVTLGTMTLTQREAHVEGTYTWYGGLDTGQIDGIVINELDQFQGVWISDRSTNSQSFLRWKLADDRDSFSGSFEGSRTGQWCGVRSGQSLPAGCGFSGDWQLHFGSPDLSGQATLVQTGQSVQGTYVDSQGQTGTIEGVIAVDSITEMKLTGTWRNDQGEADTFEWRFDLTTGNSFQGRRDPGNSEWCGWRAGTDEPDPCGWVD